MSHFRRRHVLVKAAVRHLAGTQWVVRGQRGMEGNYAGYMLLWLTILYVFRSKNGQCMNQRSALLHVSGTMVRRGSDHWRGVCRCRILSDQTSCHPQSLSPSISLSELNSIKSGMTVNKYKVKSKLQVASMEHSQCQNWFFQIYLYISATLSLSPSFLLSFQHVRNADTSVPPPHNHQSRGLFD